MTYPIHGEVMIYLKAQDLKKCINKTMYIEGFKEKIYRDGIFNPLFSFAPP